MQFNYPELRAITEYLNDMNDENSELENRFWRTQYISEKMGLKLRMVH